MEATLAYAETHFPQLMRHVKDGEEILLRDGAMAVAKIVPLPAPPAKARPKVGETTSAPVMWNAAPFAPLKPKGEMPLWRTMPTWSVPWKAVVARPESAFDSPWPSGNRARMSAPQIAPFTAADYREMPDDGRRYQLVEGEFFMAPAPNTFHQSIQANLICILRPFVLQHASGAVLGAPCDVYLDDSTVFQPAVIYVTREHAARIHDDGIHGAPDLAIEILSPSSATLDRRKRSLLARAGTVEFWQVDPALRQIQRFVFAESAAKPVALIDEPETFSSALFSGLTLATAEIFRR